VAYGARIGQDQASERQNPYARIGQDHASKNQNPYNEKGWMPDKSRFVCVQNLKANPLDTLIKGVMDGFGRPSSHWWTSHWCLTDLDDIEKAFTHEKGSLTSKKPSFAHSVRGEFQCADNSQEYFALCNLKGKKDNMRISWKSRVFIPRDCFDIVEPDDRVGVGYDRRKVHHVFKPKLTKAKCGEFITWWYTSKYSKIKNMKEHSRKTRLFQVPS
jgi:hypothetical protein